ncbi:hypothetical protein SAV14893_051230 [Streptomyces avermitilis]|uniref:Uncharacterized protein n=1 Tax=Streptomyces avermitilis TaxID=33903 RepID=A0A4D4LZP1_STRAX|nr:hypothetical protein SAV14893_051230 [Streptomyces avermitilis]
MLVLPDRDAAQEAAEALGERFALDEEPQLVRDALAGEDDAEDAQWLLVLRDERGGSIRRSWMSSRGSGTGGGRSLRPGTERGARRPGAGRRGRGPGAGRGGRGPDLG